MVNRLTGEIHSLALSIQRRDNLKTVEAALANTDPFAEIERAAQTIPLHALPNVATIEAVTILIEVVRLARQTVAGLVSLLDGPIVNFVSDREPLSILKAAAEIANAKCWTAEQAVEFLN